MADLDKAVRYFRMAVDQGHKKALDRLYKLGIDHDDVEDLEEAIHYFRMAADKGHADAQYKLGLCYVKGEGVTMNLDEADLDEAVRYFRMAVDQGHK